MSYLPMIRPKKEYPHVEASEAELIIAAAKSPRTRLFIKLIWQSGLRINEVLPLQRKSLQQGPEGFVLVVTRLKKRTQKTERLPISHGLGVELDDYCQAAKLKPDALIFSGHENSFRYQLRMAAKRAGLPNWKEIHPHSFRHGFVYEKVKHGVHPLILTKLVGHSSLNITMQYYQPTERDLRAAIEQ